MNRSSDAASGMPPVVSVVLAAGLSSRMKNRNTNKVCLELQHRPVICRALEACERNGVRTHVVTVSLHAEAAKVMECVTAEFDNVLFAVQRSRRGTADALGAALAALPAALRESDALALVVPGHRILGDGLAEELYELYRGTPGAKVAEVVLRRDGKARKLSIYLGRIADFAAAWQQLSSEDDGVQELDLAALAEVMCRNAPDGHLILPVDDPARVLGFTNPEEFLLVSEQLRDRTERAGHEVDPEEYHPLAVWREAVRTVLAEDETSPFAAIYRGLYGGDPVLVRRQAEALSGLLAFAAAGLPETEPVAVVRSPGRVNVMGRHVDHQGGNCNLMTIGYETMMVVHLRHDDLVTVRNLDPEFAPAEFRIGELVRDLPWDDWQTLVGSAKLSRLLKQYGVNWADYIKAVFLRFQKHFSNRRLKGMDLFVQGNVPMAAGLSSSSTLVVGAAEAVTGGNRLDLMPEKLVTLCGEGEWFVGTRGGAADHAAVKLGRCNKVVKVGFFDFRVEELVDFPQDYALVVGDSGIKARKSSNAKDQFNHRVSCYRIGFELLKKACPQYRGVLHHLRDFNAETLGVPPEWIYRFLKVLPEAATRRELEALLPEIDLSVYWRNHAEPADGIYPVRGVVLYGLAECARSAMYVEVLRTGNMEQVGHLMNVSHDGDRVVRFDRDGENPVPYRYDSGDAALDRLGEMLAAGDPAGALAGQPGSYRCSLPDIDRMVDLALGVPGVVGAQLAGAGLGGCMMVLVRSDRVDELYRRLEEAYYRPAGREARLLLCRPIAGAGAIRFPQ